MGYSFATPIKSPKARDNMVAFLEKHYRPWEQIIEPFKGELENGRGIMPFVSFDTRARGPLADDLAYDHGKCKIGFDYGAGFSDGERYWMYNFCYWMAQRAGRRRVFTKKAPDCGAVPYVVYDGYEAWPVLEASDYKDKVGEHHEWLVENGFRGMVSLIEWEKRAQEKSAVEKGLQIAKDLLDYYTGRAKGAQVVDKAIKVELDRLSKLWETWES